MITTQLLGKQLAGTNDDFVDVYLIIMQKHAEIALDSFDYDSVW